MRTLYKSFCLMLLMCNLISIPLFSNATNKKNPRINFPLFKQSNIDFSIPYRLTEAMEEEELIQQMKSALYTIYSEKKIKFNDFNVDKSGKEITLSGTAQLYRENITISSTFTTDRKLLKIAGKFSPGTNFKNQKFKNITTDSKGKSWFPRTLQDKIQVDNISFSFDEATQKLSELKLDISTASGWTMIQQGALQLKAVTGSFVITNPKGARSISATLGGKFDIGNTSISTSATVGSGSTNWSFSGELENFRITDVLKKVVGSLGNVPMPTNFVDASIVKSSFTIEPTAKKFSLDGTGAIGGQELGDLELRIAGGGSNSKSLNFLVGISPSASFKMANIEPSLKMLDDLDITNFGLVLSSSANSSTNLKIFNSLGNGAGEVGRGLNFIGAFDLTAVDMDELLGLKSIMLRAVVSSNLSDLLLEAALNVSIPLGEVATFKKIKFKLKPSPANFKISMGGDIEVKVDKDLLTFKSEVGVDVTDQALFVDGKVVGMWNEPFGAKGLSIGDLWIYLDLSFRTTPIPLPAIGIAGKLKANDFEGDLALVMNTNNPSESAIDAGFNELDLKAILETFCDKQTLSKIPSEVRNTILDVSLEDVRLTVVPRPMTINTTSYDAGFRAKGTAKVADMGAMLDVNISYDGIDAKASMEKISHLPYFELAGSRGNENPSLQILAKSNEAKVAITGSATLLGVKSEADMLLNDKGFDLFVAGKIFDVFQADLEVSGSRVKDGGSFRVKAAMKQDFMEYFTKHASEEIDKATKQTQDDIKKAQDEITKGQREVAKLDGEINTQRSIVKKERDRDLANMRAAEQELENARREVQKIQGDIDAAHRVIAETNARIQAKDDWINSGNIFEAAARGTESIPFFAEQGAILTAKAAEIAGLETAKGIADGTLYLSKEAMKGFRHLGELTPVDMDPRVSTLIASKESAIGLMEAAKGILEGGKIIGVGTLQASKWIVENGPLGVVNITEASFEGKLSAADGGSVTLKIKGTFSGNPLNETFTFNFNNPLDEVVKFAESLL